MLIINGVKRSVGEYLENVTIVVRVAYDANGNPAYIGRARPGAMTSAAEWQIARCDYDTDGNMTCRSFASGTNRYTKVWDDRESYVYT